jgi:hypothetical protein
LRGDCHEWHCHCVAQCGPMVVMAQVFVVPGIVMVSFPVLYA